MELYFSYFTPALIERRYLFSTYSHVDLLNALSKFTDYSITWLCTTNSGSYFYPSLIIDSARWKLNSYRTALVCCVWIRRCSISNIRAVARGAKAGRATASQKDWRDAYSWPKTRRRECSWFSIICVCITASQSRNGWRSKKQNWVVLPAQLKPWAKPGREA